MAFDMILPGEDKRIDAQPTAIGAPPATNAPAFNMQLPDDAPDTTLATSTVRNSLAINPDKAAQTNSLADATGIPASTVGRNFDDVAAQKKLSDIRQAMAVSPILTRQLTDPQFAAMAHDDVGNLSLTERVLAKIRDPFSPPNSAVPHSVMTSAGYAQLVQDLKTKNPGLDWDQLRTMASQMVDVDNSPGGISAPTGPKPGLDSVAIGLQQSMINGFESARGGARQQFGDYIGASEMSARGAAERNSAKFKQSLVDPDFAKNGAGSLLYGGAENVLQNVPGLAMAMLTRNPYMAVAPAVAQTEVEGYGTARARGASVGASTAIGGLQAGVEAATEFIPMNFLLKSFGSKTLMQVFKGEQIREQFGEQIATHAQDAIDTAIANPNMTWGEYFKQRPDASLQTAVGVLMQGAVISGAGVAHRSFTGRTDAVRQAEQDAQSFADLLKAASESKLRERDPQAYSTFVNQAAAGGQVTEAYIDAEALKATLDQGGIDRATFARMMPTAAAQFDEALAAGGLVTIPLGEMAASLPGTGLEQAFVEHLKSTPDSPSKAETTDFYQNHAAEFQKEAERIVAQSGFNSAFSESAASVQKELQGQLDRAGRFTPDVNQAYAKLMASFYTVQAARLGVTPEQMYVKYPLRVEAIAPTGSSKQMDAGLAQGEQDGDRHFDAAALSSAREAGQLIYMPPEDFLNLVQPESADKEKTKNLATLSEAGTKIKDLPELKLRTNKDGSTQIDMHDGRHRARQMLRLGVKSMPVIVTGDKPNGTIRGQGDNRNNTLNVPNGVQPTLHSIFDELDQSGPLLAPNGKPSKLTAEQHAQVRTAEFKAWFGDWESFASRPSGVWSDTSNSVSKVVDENGEPLIVYHGSTKAGFETFEETPNKGSGGFGGKGTFTTPNLEMARSYGDRNRVGRADLMAADDYTVDDARAGIYALFLNIRNPLEAHFEGANWDGTRYDQYEVRDVDGDTIYHNGKAFHSFEDAEDLAAQHEGAQVEQAMYHHQDTDAVADEAHAYKHDGAIITEVQDSGGQNSGYAGEPDTVFIAFDPNQIKSADFNEGAFSKTDDRIFAQATPTGRRGVITLDNRGVQGHTSVITLLNNADLSTFLHESGHFYLEVMADIATQPDAPPQIVADMQQIMQWFGYTGTIAEWAAMPIPQRREMHEQFAQGFEQYLFEGKAPSVELNSVFARFRSWLISVYQSITALTKTPGGTSVNLTPEVRGVMDRMIAAEADIAHAEASMGYSPIFADKPETMTTEEWTAYQNLGADATEAAITKLQTRSVRDMQWLSGARDRILKKLQREAAGKRKAIRSEVAAEVNAEPVYRAMQFFKTGEFTGANGEDTALVDHFKLDRAALAEMYPPGAIDHPDLSGLRGMTQDEGLHPNLAADLLGFTSGDELVRSILGAEKINDKIEGITDQRMLQRYGDLSDPVAIERATDIAIHNEARTKFVATELTALERATGKPKTLITAAKDFAANIIARKKIADIKPSVYGAAETRNGLSAQKALKAGDTIAAATEKRNQLVNHYAEKAATASLTEVEKGVDYLRRIGESASIDREYREQIQAMLERFDLRQVSNKDAERRKSLVQWVERQQALGFDPAISEQMLNEAYRTPYKQMTVEEFRGLVDAVKNIAHLGRLKHKLLTIRDKRDFDATVAEVATSIEENAKHVVPQHLEKNSWKVKLKNTAAGFFAMHRKFANMMREMDAYNDNGVLWNTFVRPMNEAGDRESVMREQATEKLTAILDKMPGFSRFGDKVFIPEINASLSREGRIMVALNTGNEGNLQRLMDGDHWTVAQVQAIVSTLSREELNFVQNIWDMIGEYKEQIGAQQKALTGLTPEWVEPVPRNVTIKNADGTTETVTLKGGYLPAKYDTDRSTRSLSDEARTGIMDQWRAAGGRAKTRDSFTKGRASAVVDRPLRKDFGVVTQHLTEVTHRLAWQEYLIDAQRLLGAGAVDAAIREHYGPQILKALHDTLKDVAAGEVGAQSALEASLNYIRVGATVAGLGWRLTTALLQPIGLTQSMVRIGPKYVGKGLAEWLGDAGKFENTIKKISEKSDMMRLRAKTMQREISEIRNKVTGKDSQIEASFFYLIQKLQLVADVPTWLGQYSKSIEHGADEDTAVAQADQAVLDAQGGGQLKDLAGVQRGGGSAGSAMLKLFTNFYSFFSTTYNLTSESYGRTNFKSPASVAMLATDMILLYTLPAVLSTLLKAALKGDMDDKDKLKRQLIADQLTYMLGTMVGVREMSGAVQTSLGLPGDYQGPASVRLFAEMAKLGKQVNQGEADASFWKTLNNVGGILLHYPAGQINATAEGIKALHDGTTHNPGALIVGPPPKQ